VTSGPWSIPNIPLLLPSKSLYISHPVDLLLDQGLPEETDIDTVHTLDPGLAQGTGRTETEEPSFLHHLYTLTEGWDITENVREVKSRLEDL
jgi:hypothetical protein